MQNKDQNKRNKEQSDEYGNRGQGMQGIDKAPGEETNKDNVHFTQDAFRGKKVDRDPSNEEDNPLDVQDV